MKRLLLVLSVVLVLDTADADLLTNLISYWKLDETSGTRVDAVTGNDLTDNNTVGSTTGKINNSASFVAANLEYLSHASNASLQTGDIDFTVAGWVKLSSKSAYQWLVSKDDGTGREYALIYHLGSDRIGFVVWDSGAVHSGEVHADALGSPSTGTWYYVVAWHDSVNNTVNIQVNNGSVDSVAYTWGVVASTSEFDIGRSSQGANYTDGLVDEVGFWKRVLTSQEITDLYNGGLGWSYPFSPLTQNLISYWKLDEASGTRIDAVTATGNDLTDNNTVGSTTGKINNAANFIAANSESLSHLNNASVTCGDIDFTFAAWVNLTSKVDGYIVSKISHFLDRDYALVYFNGATDRFAFIGGSGFVGANANSFGAPSTGVWYFVVGWHDATAHTYNIKINNGATDSVSDSGSVPMGQNASQFFLGSYDGTQAFLNGAIDEIGFWKRVLTGTEITQLYNAGAGLAYPFTTGANNKFFPFFPP